MAACEAETNSLCLQEDLNRTQDKLHSLDEDYRTLKGLSKTAAQEFDLIKAKCKEYHDKFQGEHEKYLKAKQDLDRLKDISSQALDEYENLHRKFEVEQECRDKAVEIASKISNQNKQLKRQSQMIITQISGLNGGDSFNLGDLHSLAVDISISDDSGSESSTTVLQEEIKELQGMIESLKLEVDESRGKQSEAQQLFSQEKEAHTITRKKLYSCEKQLKQLNRVSVLAYEEFNILQQRYELEAHCRFEAEKLALDAKRNDEEVNRKTEILKEANQDERLVKAFADNDKLREELEQLTAENEEKIKELLEEMKLSKDCEYMKGMQNKMDIAQDQIENLENQVIEAQKKATEAENKVSELNKSLEEAKKSAAALPPPPPPPSAPPPPPPPPPPPQQLIKKFINIMGKKKKGDSLKRKKKPEDPLQNAMKEMMDRINKGKIQLKRVNVPQHAGEDSEDAPAMSELGSLLKSMKTKSSTSLADRSPTSPTSDEPAWAEGLKLRKRSDVQLPRQASESGENPAWQAKSVLRKPRSRSMGDMLDDKPKADETSSELKKILQKQKANAEREMMGQHRIDEKPREESSDT